MRRNVRTVATAVRFCTAAVTGVAFAILAAAEVWAHEGPHDGGATAKHAGAWGLIVLGALFCLVGLLPARAGPRDEAAAGGGLALLRMLQARIEKETTGWRRLQWPLLGVFFILLGAATLAGWR